MKSLFICFSALLLIIGLPWVFTSIDNARSDDVTQNFASVSTGAGATSANVTLGEELYENSIASVTDISSNLTGLDSPSAYYYNSVSQILTVSGLVASNTRTLEVGFRIDTITVPADMLVLLTIFRWFYVFAILGLEGGAIYAFFDVHGNSE